jgi:hypothetical protein
MLILFLCYAFSLKFSGFRNVIPDRRRKNTTRFRVVRVIFVAVIFKSNIQTVQHGQGNKIAACKNNNINQIELFTNVFRVGLLYSDTRTTRSHEPPPRALLIFFFEN